MHYGLITEQSRKSRSAKNLYDFIRLKSKAKAIETEKVAEWPVQSGYKLAVQDRNRILDMRLHDEHMSPYFKTNMNLFHMLMINETIEMSMFRTQEGILFVFEGIPDNPHPFGAHGHDTR